MLLRADGFLGGLLAHGNLLFGISLTHWSVVLSGHAIGVCLGIPLGVAAGVRKPSLRSKFNTLERGAQWPYLGCRALGESDSRCTKCTREGGGEG